MTDHFGRVDIRLQRDDFELAVDFAIPAKGVTGIFGSSGCGKTSLLRCIAGLEHGATGRIQVNGDSWLDSVNGKRLSPAERAIGYVFQDGRLFPHKSVRNNLLYGEARRGSRAAIASLDDVVDLLGIGNLLERKPAALSGGEQQRVAIGRALLSAPRLMLMDEPLANLDRARKREILPYLDRLHAELRVPMLYVSHSFGEVARLCDHLLLLEKGRVQAAGELETLLADLDLGETLGDMAGAVLPVTSLGWREDEGLSRLHIDGMELRVPERLEAGELRLRILASDVSIVVGEPAASSILNVMPATIIDWRNVGDAMVLVRLSLAGRHLLARISRASLVQLKLLQGQAVHVQIKGAAIRR